MSASLSDAAATRAAILPGSLGSRIALLDGTKQGELRIELARLDQQIAAASNDLLARIARAELLGKFGLAQDAAAEYRALAEVLPGAEWTKSRLLVLESQPAPKPPPNGGIGKTYALLVGISKYKLAKITQLQFAHSDAQLLRDYLMSPRGGAVPASQIQVLQDDQATTGAVRSALQSLKEKQLGPDDRIVLLFASHGTAIGEKRQARGFFVTYDTDPESLPTTALEMSEVRQYILTDLKQVGLVMGFVDVCRSGYIGLRTSGNVNAGEQIDPQNGFVGDLFLYAGSRANQNAQESAAYGGGHGAFTYFLADALNGSADINGDGVVDVTEVIEYVRDKVKSATAGRQIPTEGAVPDARLALVADTKREGIIVAGVKGQTATLLAGARSLGTAASAQVQTGPVTAEFEAALAAGRLTAETPNNALEALNRLRTLLSPDEYQERARRLRVALENRGQEVILRYLSGELAAQSRQDFLAGAADFSTAAQLTDANAFLDSRAQFCYGRAAVFERDYPRAADLLERSIRQDPVRGYAYNGLGISFLEQARYPEAIAAFRDAIRREPDWAYPRHNLALAYTQIGDYDSAIRIYEEAMRLAPGVSYLPYNLGLVYLRMNRVRDAERLFRQAMALSPEISEPYNGLGAVAEAKGEFTKAEEQYREALRRNGKSLPARQNLAALLAKQNVRIGEAIALWRENLALASEYLPSRLSLARALRQQGDTAQSAAQFREVIRLRPDYVAARVELADEFEKLGDRGAAEEQIREALSRASRNPLLHERLADLQARGGNLTDSKQQYREALALALTGPERKRLRKKLERFGSLGG